MLGWYESFIVLPSYLLLDEVRKPKFFKKEIEKFPCRWEKEYTEIRGGNFALSLLKLCFQFYLINMKLLHLNFSTLWLFLFFFSHVAFHILSYTEYDSLNIIKFTYFTQYYESIYNMHNSTNI